MLHVVMYHYIRDLVHSPYPKLKAMLRDDFIAQIDELRARYEMATLETALAFLAGQYQPKQDLCLLTFDDGLKEHFGTVTPLLAERGIQGLFFVITRCPEEHRVAPVHMNHFLMAKLGFDDYSAAFLARLTDARAIQVLDAVTVSNTYPWDGPQVARFKYLFNFVLAPEERDAVVRALFAEHLGLEAGFSRELYLSWKEARAMQAAGMVIGGHTHEHRPVAVLNDAELDRDLVSCRELLAKRLAPQALWPFSFPYGKKASFDERALKTIQSQGYHCAFVTETGPNPSFADRWQIRRMDCKVALHAGSQSLTHFEEIQPQ
jgi:peptidoglycan/xylan/chitin deacetylase (PgdA/CDA1 family)